VVGCFAFAVVTLAYGSDLLTREGFQSLINAFISQSA
jgi:hypothetical protein